MSDPNSNEIPSAQGNIRESSFETNAIAGADDSENSTPASDGFLVREGSLSDGTALTPDTLPHPAPESVHLPRRSGYRDERVREGNRLLDRRAVPRDTSGSYGADTGTWKRRSSEMPEAAPAPQQPAWLSLESDHLQQRQHADIWKEQDPAISAPRRRTDEA